MEYLLKNFYKRLKELRVSYEKTQKEIAEYIGISYQAYQAYELGISFPTFENFIKLCAFFELTPNDLLGIE